MVNDIFGGFVKGLGAFMPKDDPNTKLILTQTEIGELENRELVLYAEIGTKAFESVCDNPEYSDLVSELNFVQKKLETLKIELRTAQNIKLDKERTEQEKLIERTCPNCDFINQEGVKFCQECGARLICNDKFKCLSCGTENSVGTRFCGECGHKL